MKKALFTVVVLVVAALGLLLVLKPSFPSDVVESNYLSLQAAREDQLFERGWLPEILPASSFNIRTNNNLDLNTSEGELSFSAQDWAQFKSQLSTGAPATSPFVGWLKELQSMQNQGYSSFSYGTEGLQWVFFCKPQQGYCKYVLWARRQG